jgi:hypothetical protein
MDLDWRLPFLVLQDVQNPIDQVLQSIMPCSFQSEPLANVQHRSGASPPKEVLVNFSKHRSTLRHYRS